MIADTCYNFIEFCLLLRTLVALSVSLVSVVVRKPSVVLIWQMILMRCHDRHVQDLGNVQPDDKGRVRETRQSRLISLFGDNDIIGKVADVSSFTLSLFPFLSVVHFFILLFLESTFTWLVN